MSKLDIQPENKALSADDILNADDSGIQKIYIPEWGGDVYIRTMSGQERDSWELYASKELGKTADVNIRAKLACITLCDKDGKKAFGDGQIAALSKKSSIPLNRVYEAALRLNSLSQDDIDEIEKN